MATGEGLPDELREWVERRAAERGVDTQRVLAQAVLASREAERLADDPETAALVDRLDRVDDLESEVEAVETRLDDLDAEVDDLIDDVRERVVQVKREVDDRAPADHDHPDLLDAATTARADAEAASEDATAAREAVADLDARVDDLDGTLADLSETTDRLGDRTDTLARVAVDARDTLRRLRAAEQTRAAAEEIRRTANRNGDAKASCEDCGRTVRLGLLSEPRCPHCDASVSGLDPSGFVGKATLRTGHQPALDGETEATDPFEGGADG
jgi:DNA repair exonuclease SbcCD ATPase subunit